MPIEEGDFASSGVQTGAGSGNPITPADVNLDVITRGVYLDVAGKVIVKMAGNGQVVTLDNLAVGVIHPLRVTQVRIGTTATVIAFW